MTPEFSSPFGTEFVQLSLVPLVVGILASVSCALLGNFLVLRRQSLVADAVSHVALPGIVTAFLITETVDAGPMLVGAAAAALITVGLIEVIRRLGRIESGAAIGVVFTVMFAAGVLLLEQSDTRSVHLDVQHALYGNLESMIWFSAAGWQSLIDPMALASLPPQVSRLLVATVLIAAVIVALWKELFVGTFDPAFAASIGARPKLVSGILIVLVALAAVTAFDAVGSIIVVAMFICPPAAARLMTDRLRTQIWWSVVFAVVSAVVGYVLAGYGPGWFGVRTSVSAAGMIATVSGLIFGATCIWGSRRRGIAA